LPIPDPPLGAPPPSDRVTDLGEASWRFSPWACATRASGHVDCWDNQPAERLPDIDDALAVRDLGASGRCILRRSEITCTRVSATREKSPSVPIPLHDAVALADGWLPCAIRADHRVACWYEHQRLELVSALHDVTAVAGNGFAACATHADGTVSCADGSGRGR